MLRDALFTLLSQRLGNRSDLIPRMETEAQLLQEVKLERNEWLPWFLETEIASTETVAGEERVQWPSDFLGEIEEQALWLYVESEGNSMIPLRKMTYDEMIARYPGAGRPLAYASGAEYIYLRPIPDAAYILRMRYYAKDVVLDINIENKWLKYASDVVLAELGLVMASKHMQHNDLAAVFAQDAQAAWRRLYNAHVARQEANLERVMEA